MKSFVFLLPLTILGGCTKVTGNRDERATKGYKLYRSLLNLQNKLNKLTQSVASTNEEVNVQQPPHLENLQSAGNNHHGGDSKVTYLRREDRNDDAVNYDLSPAFDLLNFSGNNGGDEGGGIELKQVKDI